MCLFDDGARPGCNRQAPPAVLSVPGRERGAQRRLTHACTLPGCVAAAGRRQRAAVPPERPRQAHLCAQLLPRGTGPAGHLLNRQEGGWVWGALGCVFGALALTLPAAAGCPLHSPCAMHGCGVPHVLLLPASEHRRRGSSDCCTPACMPRPPPASPPSLCRSRCGAWQTTNPRCWQARTCK